MFAVTIAHFDERGSQYFQELGEEGENYSQKIELPNGDADELRTEVRKSRDTVGEGEEEVATNPDNYEVYNAKIENLKNVGEARIGDQSINSLIVPTSFNMYIDLERDALIGFTKKSDTQDLLDYLTGRIEDVNLRAGICKINVLELILEEASEAKGGFFDDIDIGSIDSSALFGDNVDQSEDFKRFTEDGDVTDQTIYVPYRGQEVKLKAHRSGILLFFGDYSPAFVLNFITDIILPYCEVQLPN